MVKADLALTPEEYASSQAAQARTAEQATNKLIDQAVQSNNSSAVGPMSVEQELAIQSRINDLLLQKCSTDARGPMQIACSALKNGLSWGTSTAKTLQLNLDISAGTLSGAIDLSSMFGSWAKNINFVFTRSSLTLTMPKAARVTLGGFITKMTGSGLSGDGPIGSAIVSSLRLNDLGFTLNSVVISISPLAIKLDAVLDIMGLQVPVSIVAGQFRGFAVGLMVNIDQAHADDFISRAFSESMRNSISWFRIKALSFGLSTANINFASYPELSIMNPDLGQEVKKGLQFGMKVYFDKFSNNKLGATLGRILGPNAFFFVKIYINSQELGLNLGLPDFKLDSAGKFMITDTGLFMKWRFPAELRLGLTSTLAVKMSGQVGETVLKFKASIFLTTGPPPGVGMSMVMEGMWERAFGIKVLSIGNLMGEVVIISTPPYVGAIELGGEAHLGEAKLAIGVRVDVSQPTNSWFYADAQKLSIGTIFTAVFGQSMSLPKYLADTGFPDKAEISFAFKDSVALNGREIPLGFKAKGRFFFLGYNIVLDAVISKTRFKFFGEFDPINFANGLVKMVRSSQDTSKGPLVNIDIAFAQLSALVVEIRGYVKLFMFEAEVQVFISSSKISVDVTTLIFGMFKARVQLNAQFASLKSASFSYQVDLDVAYFLKSMSDAFSRVAEMVNSAFKAANEALEGAKKSLEMAKCDIPRVCGVCSIEMSSLSMLEVNATHDSNADREMIITAHEHSQIHEHLLDTMGTLSSAQMEQRGMMYTNEEVWGQHVRDQSLLEIQAWHNVIAEERLREYRRMHESGDQVPDAIMNLLEQESSSEEVTAAAVDRLRAEEQSLRSGNDERQRSPAEIQAILMGDASKFLQEESTQTKEQRSLLEMEAMLEDGFGVDLEFYESEDLIHEIRLRRIASGKSEVFDEEDYNELETRFKNRRSERKRDLLARVQRRRLRHYHRTKLESHTRLADSTHDRLQKLSIKQLGHLKKHVSKRKIDRKAKLEDEASEEARSRAEFSRRHLQQLHRFIQHHKYEHDIHDVDGHMQVEEQADQSLSEMTSTLFHHDDHADRLHDMVHVLHHHRVQEEATSALHEKLYQTHKQLYKSGAFFSESWQLQQRLAELDREEHALEASEFLDADVDLMDELLDKIKEAEKSGAELVNERSYSDSLEEAMRRFPQPQHHVYDAHSQYQHLLPAQWQSLLTPHVQADFSRKVREYISSRTDIEIRRRLFQKRLKEVEEQSTLIEVSGEMMAWMNMLDARDREIEASRFAKKAEEERREQIWADRLRTAGMEEELMEVEAEHAHIMNNHVYSRVFDAPVLGQSSPADCYADTPCRDTMIKKNTATVERFNALWNSNQALQHENAQRLYQLKVELCHWTKKVNSTGTTYAPPSPPVAPVKGETETDESFQARLGAYSDLVEKIDHCAVDYDPCPANIPCSKSIVEKQYQLGRDYERMRGTVVPILDPSYAAWGAAMLIQEQSCWDLDNPIMTTMCIEDVQRDLSEHKPKTPVEYPAVPRPNLNFFQRIACNVKRAFCIVGCTIKNIALAIAQGILSACQGILGAIRWVLSQVTALLSDLAKNIQLSVMFGAALSTAELSFKVAFQMTFYPISFSFQLDLKLSLLKVADIFKVMLDHVWQWFLSKIGAGSMKTVASKNPALNSEFGI